MGMTTEFGRRLKAARKKAGLTQKQLAPLAEMSQSNLSELETIAHGSSKTPQLARVCGVNAHWLATGEGDMEDLQVMDAPMGSGGFLMAAMNQVSSPGRVTRVFASSLAQLPAARRQLISRVVADSINDPSIDQTESIDLLAPGVVVTVGLDWRADAYQLANEHPNRVKLLEFLELVDHFQAGKADAEREKSPSATSVVR